MKDWPAEFERGSDGFIHLHRTYSDLYKKTNYLTKVPLYIGRITEYDIRAANLSAMRDTGKFSAEILEKLEASDKHTREVKVGIMIRHDASIGKMIKKGILKARENLFRANCIQESDVISIKNDAVYVVGKRLKHLEFGPFKFIPKNVYSLLFQLDRIEFYYDSRKHRVDVKGLGSGASDPDIQEGMLKFFAEVFRYLLSGRRNDLRKYLIRFSTDYKSKKLPVQYYKEMTSSPVYRTMFEIAGFDHNLTTATDHDREIINGIYNYNRYIIPVIQTFL